MQHGNTKVIASAILGGTRDCWMEHVSGAHDIRCQKKP